MSRVSYKEVNLPELKVPNEVPELPIGMFQARYEKLERTRQEAGYDCLIMYADREHFANMAWLTDYDPRFEEALWIQGLGRKPVLLVGNENFDFARAQVKLDADVWLFQPFSLPDQDRSKSASLPEILAKAGVVKGLNCGIIGWKTESQPDIPYWIVQAINDLTGIKAENATGLLINASAGLRLELEPEMVRFFEYASSLTSESLKMWVRSLREGISERDAAQAFNSFGLELSCHPMVNFNSVIPSGLKSPRNNRAVKGEFAQAALGVRGALTSRSARLVDLATPDADDYLALVENYLTVVHAWYRALSIGASGGRVFAAADGARNDQWDFALNPGHLIHLDEWAASPFYQSSQDTLRSGLAIQQDIIPVPRTSKAAINMEDGLVLADEDLRNRLWQLDKPMMERIVARKSFMEQLGYEVHEDVLPLSNIAGAYFPFLLEPTVVAVFS